MNAEYPVEDLLEELREYPDIVFAVLDTTEQDAFMAQLASLAQQAAILQNGADLLGLVPDLYHLVADRPGLRECFLSSKSDLGAARAQRGVTLQDVQAGANRNMYLEERAPQIRNAVITCHEQLAKALRQKRTGQARDGGQTPEQGEQ